MTDKYTIEHNFSYGWDLLNDQELDIYDTRAEAQDAIDEIVYQIGDSDSEDYRVKEILLTLTDWELEQVEAFATYIAQSVARAAVLPEPEGSDLTEHGQEVLRNVWMSKANYYFGKLEEIFRPSDQTIARRYLTE